MKPRFVALFLGAILSCPSFAAEAPASPWSFHFQATVVSQAHPGLASPYTGQNSLKAGPESATSFTSTLFLGHALWKNAELYVNPEIVAGSGFSGTHGVAGFPNGEIFRVDSPSPKPNLSRLFLRQAFELGGASETLEKVEDDFNQLPRGLSSRRIAVTAGKFSLNDFLDDNLYSHDPRTQFFNWGLMDNLAWDYAADTRGYTWGFVLEYRAPAFTLRWAEALEPAQANQLELDTDLAHAHGDNLELECRHLFAGRPGKIRGLVYSNHAHMGSYAAALADGSSPPDVTLSRAYRVKYGAGLNLEQALSDDLGFFSRLGWNDGQSETWAFAEVDRTFSLGASLKGAEWGRSDDTVGLALLANGLSRAHADYFAAGGAGFMLGDGRLRYAPEEIAEVYYLWKPRKDAGVSADFQWIEHPAYNADRGPAEVVSVRLHYEI